MGDRLISAEKLKNHYAWWDDEKKEIFDTIVDLQPTAYDTGKVVEQLAELKAQEYDDSDEAAEWEDIENVYEDGRSQGRYEAYHRAIEIVSRGGADES